MRRITRARRLLHGLVIGSVAATLSIVVWSAGLLDRWEFTTWAWRVAFFAKPGPATDKVKLVLLDQSSLNWGEEQNGWSWPWPREVYGPIIDFCKRSGARAVIFDVLFTEPSLYGVPDDAALKSAISRSPRFVAAMGLGREAGDVASWPTEITVRETTIENMDKWLGSANIDRIRAPYAVFPIPEVTDSAAILAGVSDEPDIDGIFRRAGLFRIFDGKVIPSLGLAPFVVSESGLPGAPDRPQAGQPEDGWEAGPVNGPTMRIERGRLHFGDRSVPIDDSGKAILRFRGAAGAHESFSAAAVIQSELRLQAGEAPPIETTDVFKDCYVFFGFCAPGLLDLRPTPIANVYPGVEIYATMLDNLLSNDFLRDMPDAAVFFTTFLLAICTGMGISLSRKASHTVAAFAIFLPIPVILGFAAYPLGFWSPIVVKESAVALALVGGVVVNYATEGRRKLFIKHVFKHYLSPAVIEQILDNPSQLQLGGERRELTIFFSDLQGFSSFSERLDPPALTSLLNDYLSDMTDIILEEGGTLDKYEGDAIIAFWSAPVAQPDHAARACRAALRCRRRLDERREEFRQKWGVLLRARIGINTGEVVVGNMGSRKRFDYTVLGDAANLASRLEGANKAFDTLIMVSETTWSQAAEQFVGREIGQLRVVGRKTPVRVFEILGLTDEADCPRPDAFHQGLALCYCGRYAEALAIFEDCADDPVAKVYKDRCRCLLQSPEAAEWDGVWNLTEK